MAALVLLLEFQELLLLTLVAEVAEQKVQQMVLVV
jgi:hypothetical protein